VADEVRALAERTAKATHEITGMIRSIQQETGDAVKAIEEGVLEVADGREGALQSSSALKEIIKQIETVTNQVNMIAVASEQQNATTVEITNNIQQVTTVIEASTRGSEETAMSAKTLSKLAEELQALVGRFKLAA
jgi:methyl-accepting chemotaxis protein